MAKKKVQLSFTDQCKQHSFYIGLVAVLVIGVSMFALRGLLPNVKNNLNAKADTSDLVAVSGPSPITPGTPSGCNVFSTDGSNNTGAENEVSMAVDPTNKDHIVGVWSQDFYAGTMVGVSRDGGVTWVKKLIPNTTVCSGSTNNNRQLSANNWISFAPNGDLHLIVMGLGLPPFQGYSDMMALKSSDGGLTWSEPKTLTIDDTGKSGGVTTFDKPSIAVDPKDSNIVYATWDSNRSAPSSGSHALTVAISRDGGETWGAARDIYSIPTSGWAYAGAAKFVFTPKGRVMLFWDRAQWTKKADALIQVGGGNAVEQVVYTYSDDKGMNWSSTTNRLDPTIAVQLQARRDYGVKQVVADASVYNPDSCVTLKGKTSCSVFAEQPIVYDVEVDQKTGNIYMVWNDARLSNNGDFSDVMKLHDDVLLSMSSDGGVTWSAPVKINKTPANIGNGQRQTMIPELAISDTGVLGVAYYDFRNDNDNTTWMADYWLVKCNSASEDCLTPSNWVETRLSDSSFDMTGAMWRYTYFLGDYQGLQASGNDFVSMFTVPTATDKGNIYFRRVSQ